MVLKPRVPNSQKVAPGVHKCPALETENSNKCPGVAREGGGGTGAGGIDWCIKGQTANKLLVRHHNNYNYFTSLYSFVKKVMQTKCVNFVLCSRDISHYLRPFSGTKNNFIFSWTFVASLLICTILLVKTINFTGHSTTVCFPICRLHYGIDCSTGHVAYTKDIFGCFPFRKKVRKFRCEFLGISLWEKVVPFCCKFPLCWGARCLKGHQYIGRVDINVR